MDVASIEQQINSLDATSFGSEPERMRLLRAVERLQRRIEQPFETVRRVTRDEPVTFALLRIGIEVGLFEHLLENRESPKTTQELAQRCGVHQQLMARILRFLAANSYLVEEGEDLFSPTRIIESIELPATKACLAARWDSGMSVIARLPEFFESINYEQPSLENHNPFKFGMQTELGFFDWMNTKPKVLKNFNIFMAGYAKQTKRPSFASYYPARERLIEGYGSGPETVFIVDVGGGKGHDMQLLEDEIPDIPGRIILQDQPATIEQITSKSQNTEATVHDFFRPQPVKGARLYYLHSILHDWQDWQCFQIFEALKPAMKAGYSKLIIHDLVIPKKNVSGFMTSIDWTMLCNFGASLRTEEMWRDLLQRGGFKVNGFWSKPEVDQGSVIEAELA